jgi:hypothetical protein
MQSDVASIKRGQRALLDFKATAQSLNTVLSTIGLPTIGIASIGLATAKFRELSAEAAHIKDVSSAVGITTTQLQEMAIAAEKGGVQSERLNTILTQLGSRIVQARGGQGELAKVTEQYGVSLNDAEGRAKSMMQVLYDFADAMRNATNEQDRLRMATALFGESGGLMTNLMSKGSEAMQQAMEEAGQTGQVLSAETIRSLDMADKALTNFGRTWKRRMSEMGAFLYFMYRYLSSEGAAASVEYMDPLEVQARRNLLQQAKERRGETGVDQSKFTNLELSESEMLFHYNIRQEKVQDEINRLRAIQVAQQRQAAAEAAARLAKEKDIAEQARLQTVLDQINAQVKEGEEQLAFAQLDTAGKINALKEKQTTLETTLYEQIKDNSREGQQAIAKTAAALVQVRVQIAALSGDKGIDFADEVAKGNLQLRILQQQAANIRADSATSDAEKLALLNANTQQQLDLLNSLISAWREYAASLPEGTEKRLEMELRIAQAEKQVLDLRSQATKVSDNSDQIAQLRLQALQAQAQNLQSRADLSASERTAALSKNLQQQTDILTALVEKWKALAEVMPEDSEERLRLELQITQAEGQIGDIKGGAKPKTKLEQAQQGYTDLGSSQAHYQSPEEGILGGAYDMLAKIGTLGDQVNEIFTGIASDGIQAMKDGLYDVIVQGGDLSDIFASLGESVLRRMIDAVVDYGMQWVMTNQLIKTGLIATHATGETLKAEATATSVAQGAEVAAANAPAAAMSSVWSFGAAALAGIAAMLLVMALVGGMAEGGEVSGPGGPTDDKVLCKLSNKEFVVNASDAQKNLPLLHAINSGQDVSGALTTVSAAQSGAASAGSLSTGATGGGNNTSIAIVDSEEAQYKFLTDSRGQRLVFSMIDQRLQELGK